MASRSAASPVKPALETALGDADAIVRLYAAAAIGRAGEPDRALPILLSSLGSTDMGLRAESAGLLAEHARGRPAVVDALTRALRDPEPQVRIAAADALGTLGKVARPALDTLWSMLRDPDEDVRESVLRAAQAIRDSR